MTTEREFFDALKPRYDPREWVLVPQVRNGTGVQRTTRTADAVAVSLWPSRGIDAHGFEFKASRSDWKRELDNPAKAEEIGRYCAFWWVVVADPAFVHAGELPPAWGLMSLDGPPDARTVKVLTKAPRRAAQEPGWAFVAAVLRAAAEAVLPDAAVERRVTAAVGKALNDEYQLAEARRKKEREQSRADLVRVEQAVAAFERHAGVTLGHRWASEAEARRVGEAVRFVLDGGVAKLRADLDQIGRTCDRIKAAAAGVTA